MPHLKILTGNWKLENYVKDFKKSQIATLKLRNAVTEVKTPMAGLTADYHS